MTVIADYRTTLADLLHDPLNLTWSTTQMDRYINEARKKLVMDTGCLRSLQTVYFTQGVEAYTFGQVTGASITTGGAGYTSPTVSFSGGGGSGVAATLGVSGGAVTSISFSSFGSGYTSAPTANVIPNPSGVTAVTVVNPGFWFTNTPTIGFTGGAGSGAAASATMRLTANNCIPTGASSGLGYVIGDVLTVVGGTASRAATVVVTTTGGGGAVTGIAIADPGDYSVTVNGAAVATTGGTGTGCTLNLGVSPTWQINAITITASGSAYTSAPTVTITAASSINATATATVAATGTVASISVGVINVNTYDVLDVHLIWGTMRYPLKWRPWSTFSTLMRAWVGQQNQPAMWAVYGDAQIYIGPLPNQTYQAELDTVILPTAISSSDVDPIPAVAQSPIPYYAARIAKFNDQRFGEAQTFENQYNALVRDAVNAYTRRIPDQIPAR